MKTIEKIEINKYGEWFTLYVKADSETIAKINEFIASLAVKNEQRREKKRGWQTKSRPYKKYNISGPDYLGIRNKKAGKRTNDGAA